MTSRRVRSGVQRLVAVLDPFRSSKVYVRKDVVLWPSRAGRLGQSVSHIVTHGAPEVPFDLPDLLDVHDDGNNDQEMPDLAQAMEQEFFHATEDAEPEEAKRDPVSICSFSVGLSSEYDTSGSPSPGLAAISSSICRRIPGS